MRPDAGSETEDETATEADDHDDPRDDYYDYDAVARQTALALGLELADHSAVNQGTGAGGYVGGGEGEAGPYMEGREGGVEAVVKMEEEDA